VVIVALASIFSGESEKVKLKTFYNTIRIDSVKKENAGI
jgi:hypothetical protein